MITGVTSDGMYPLFKSMQDVFDYSWSKDMQKMEAIKGSSGTVGLTTPGAMNAVYGPYLQNLAYNMHNTLSVLGQKNYKTGRRFQEGLSMTAGQSSGVTRGGFAPQPVYGNYATVEMPYKVLAHRFAMNLGQTDIGDKGEDDVLTWQQQFTEEGNTFLWSQNNDLLRRVEDAPIVGQGGKASSATDPFGIDGKEIVGLESIDRIISNITEGGFLPEGYNVPWKLTSDDSVDFPSSDSGKTGALNKYRNPKATDATTGGSNFDCYVDANYTTGSTDGTAQNRQLTLAMVDNLFLSCMPYWDQNSTRGKALITGYDTLGKLQILLQPQQRFLGFQSAQVDLNGVKTVEGRDTGFQVATYNGVPVIPDLMVARGDKTSATDGCARMYLTDSDILFNGVVRAPVVEQTENSIISGRYIRLADMNVIQETQVDGKFKGLGKIIHLM